MVKLLKFIDVLSNAISEIIKLLEFFRRQVRVKKIDEFEKAIEDGDVEKIKSAINNELDDR